MWSIPADLFHPRLPHSATLITLSSYSASRRGSFLSSSAVFPLFTKCACLLLTFLPGFWPPFHWPLREPRIIYCHSLHSPPTPATHTPTWQPLSWIPSHADATPDSPHAPLRTNPAAPTHCPLFFLVPFQLLLRTTQPEEFKGRPWPKCQIPTCIFSHHCPWSFRRIYFLHFKTPLFTWSDYAHSSPIYLGSLLSLLDSVLALAG